MEICFEDLNVCPHSVTPKYQSIIKNPNVQKKHVIKIRLKPQENKTDIDLGNLEIFILLRVIDEIDYFITSISENSKAFADALAKDHDEIRALFLVRDKNKKNKASEKRPSKTILNLTDIDFIFPRHSKSDAHLRAKIGTGQITFGTLS